MARRLDVELVRRGLARSRGQAQELVRSGDVLVNGKAATKAGATVGADARLTLRQAPPPWVSRAADKLLGAVAEFRPRGLVVADKRCLDVGASTGGFTQVLLKAGASHVTALDVGHDQLAPAVAADARVEERSGRTIRGIRPGDLGPPFDIVVADVSFLSLRLALPPIAAQLTATGDAVLLVKPQFEVGRGHLGRTGVVTSPSLQTQALSDVIAAAQDLDLHPEGLISSPVRGGQGNREFLLWVTRRPGRALDPRAVETMVQNAMSEPVAEDGAAPKG
jgi:23S rRNA (cytidine1920-2'-O)/16S rRNA (cytidine1409-2'-O)-methyltransferase